MPDASSARPGNRGRQILRLLFDAPHAPRPAAPRGIAAALAPPVVDQPILHGAIAASPIASSAPIATSVPVATTAPIVAASQA